MLYLSDAFNYFAFFLIFSRRCHKLIWIYLYFWIQESSAFSFSKHFQSCCDIQKVTEPLLTHLPTSLPKHDSVDLCKLCSKKNQCVVWAHFMLIKRRCKFDKSSANKTRYFLPDQSCANGNIFILTKTCCLSLMKSVEKHLQGTDWSHCTFHSNMTCVPMGKRLWQYIVRFYIIYNL